MHLPLYQVKAEFFRMLGHPVRIRVLELLQGGPLPVRDLLADIGIEPSSLSQQLAVLKRSGIVVSTRESGNVLYALAGADVSDLLRSARRILTVLLTDREAVLEQLRRADDPADDLPLPLPRNIPDPPADPEALLDPDAGSDADLHGAAHFPR
ncbi:metalloregulator ArsR/SmtB family transcription factor [Kitasatospora sp. NPDC048540]|uniref:ArsR/SmtB family transcription factor n=1 Tax=unclassified Kitasatospora TaxID=2633591 RepID=UPI0009EBF77A|nr:metalloregulator ArsR/SmtB family transcription factor [Kitasatospora sp. MBT63]